MLYKPGGYQLHVRTAGPPAPLLKAVKLAIGEMDRTATVEAKTMRESMVGLTPSASGDPSGATALPEWRGSVAVPDR